MTHARGKAKHVLLSDVVALQVLSERIRHKNSSYTSLELNIVLANGERVNVVDHHGKERALRADAEALGEFLGVRILEGGEGAVRSERQAA